MPKWARKMLKLAACCSIFVAKKAGVLTPKYIFQHFYTNKNAGVKAFMKLTPVGKDANAFEKCFQVTAITYWKIVTSCFPDNLIQDCLTQGNDNSRRYCFELKKWWTIVI